MNDEKKKLAIVGSLAMVILCVGAFQMMGGKKPPPAMVDDKEKKPEIAATVPAPIKNPQFDSDLPVRDPFEPPADEIPKDPKLARVATTSPSVLRPLRPRHNNLTPLPPGSLGMNLQAVKTGFGYRAVGIIQGRHPAALLQDPTGNQKLVSVGSSIDPESHVDAIEDGVVFVDYRGKKLRLLLGGNPLEK